jgi:hypothetical protein
VIKARVDCETAGEYAWRNRLEEEEGEGEEGGGEAEEAEEEEDSECIAF